MALMKPLSYALRIKILQTGSFIVEFRPNKKMCVLENRSEDFCYGRHTLFFFFFSLTEIPFKMHKIIYIFQKT